MDKDRWIEILQILVRKPLRTLLASIGIGWGLLMLILFVGASKGLENGIDNQTRNIAMNSMFMWSMGTSIPYGGFQSGRRFEMNNSDVEFIKNAFKEVEYVSPRNQLGGYRGSNNVKHGSKTGAFNVYGDSPDYIRISPVKILAGRYINDKDIADRRKICVIGSEVAKLLFEEDEEQLGGYMNINGVNFLVVGVFGTYSSGEDSESALSSIFIPYTTFQKAFNWGDKIGWVSILAKPEYDIQELEPRIVAAMKTRKIVHPDDKRAFGKMNFGEQAEKMKVMNESIKKIGFIIGAFVLFAGLIGVMNIMLVTVKERTKEFGIRRAIGATPKTIITQIILETLLLTTIAALTGACLGIWILEFLSSITSGGDGGVFSSPEISFETVITALSITIIFGAIAGLLPAMRAVAIKPVDALRANG